MLNRKPKGIEGVFSFLLNSGFYLKDKYQCGELELIYSNNTIKIEILSGHGFNDQYKNVPFFCIIIISKNEENNILECDKIFSKDKLQILKDTLNGLSINSQIDVYAKFLEDNLTFLTPLN